MFSVNENLSDDAIERIEGEANKQYLSTLKASLENLVAGNIVNQIKVDAQAKQFAKMALNQMLALPGN